MNNDGWPVAGNPWPGSNSGEPANVEVTEYPVLYPSQPATEEPEHFRERRNSEIQNWLSLKLTFAEAQGLERNARSKVSKTLFPTPKKGTQRYDLGAGYNVKLDYKLNYKLGNKDKIDDDGKKIPIRDQIIDLEDEVTLMGEAHRLVFESLISWTPDISGSAYEKLNLNDPVVRQVKDMIDKVLTIEPAATPTLVFEEPKSES